MRFRLEFRLPDAHAPSFLTSFCNWFWCHCFAIYRNWHVLLDRAESLWHPKIKENEIKWTNKRDYLLNFLEFSTWLILKSDLQSNAPQGHGQGQRHFDCVWILFFTPNIIVNSTFDCSSKVSCQFVCPVSAIFWCWNRLLLFPCCKTDSSTVY